MKSLIQEPDNAILIDCLKKDTLGRNNAVARLVKLIDSIEPPFSIALNGSWGVGKTFFVKQTKLVLDAHNDLVNEYICHGIEDENAEKQIKELFSTISGGNIGKHVSIYYDAWSNDNSTDPLFSIVEAIIKARVVNLTDSVYLDFLKKMLTCGMAIAATMKGVPVELGLQLWSKEVEFEQRLNMIRSEERLKDLVNDFLDSILVKEKEEKNLVIFIDELDRCRPDFAVRLLERIKHFFNNKNIIFVFSVNHEELTHTVKNVYGMEFDGYKYLSRFFDLEISLPQVAAEKVIEFYGKETDVANSLINEVINYYNLPLREGLKVKSLCKLALKKFATFRNPSIKLKTLIDSADLLVPILMGAKMHNIDIYNRILKGEAEEEFVDICSSCKSATNIITWVLDEDISMVRADNYQFKVEELSRKFYDGFFNHDYDEQRRNILGYLHLNRDSINEILEVVNFFSAYMTIE